MADTQDVVGYPQIRDNAATFERIETMAKLRHVAMQVPDLEKAAAFYEKCLSSSA